MKELLESGNILKAHEAIVTFPDTEHDAKWRELRREVLKKYGERCMRCGETEDALEIDHIKKWSVRPDLRYELANLQVLCAKCHRWKTRQERADDFDEKLDFRLGRRTNDGSKQ